MFFCEKCYFCAVMKENLKQIVERLRSDGSVCGEFSSSLDEATTRSAIMEMASSAQGVEFLTERFSKDIEPDYEAIADDLAAHINGNRTFRHGTGTGYTSEVYIGGTWDVEACSSVLTFWGASAHVTVPEYRYVTIFCDREAQIDIETGRGSHVVCVHYCGMPESSGLGKVRYIKGE